MERGLRVLMAVVTFSAPVIGHAGQAPRPEPPRSPKAAAPIDLTGQWVSVVSEDWRYRMVTPAKGDYVSVPLNPEGVRVADTWDPEADERAGNQCRSYGAPAIMRVPGRIRITWVDDNTLQLETDAGMQRRVFRFGAAANAPAERSWQGSSVASWDLPRTGGQFGPGPPGVRPVNGSLKVVTTQLLPGYLRKNGVPYSENAALTEYFDIVQDGGGTPWLIVTSTVEDARYLRQPFVLSTQFKKQSDTSGWDPTPCSSTW